MEDAELVLRFFSLREGRYRTLKKGFKEFLTASQTEFNKLPSTVLKNCSTDFQTYMDFLSEHVGPTPFAKWRITGGTTKRMSSFNAAVFDAVAVGLSEVFSARKIFSHPNDARDALAGFESLFKDDRFFAAVSGSVNDAAKVAFRIDAMIEYLRR